MHGLIIGDPWIGLILSGAKTWEMRKTPTRIRGEIGLIRKGTGLVVARAELTNSIGPLDTKEFLENASKHCIPAHQATLLERWNHAWVLDKVSPLREPVPYNHRSGAVIWVRLSDEVAESISASSC